MSEKQVSLDKTTGWKISFESTKSAAGLQFLMLGRMAKAHEKECFFTGTGSTAYHIAAVLSRLEWVQLLGECYG